MVARFQDGWLHVIWKWNKSICAWEYGIRVGWVGKSTNQGVVGMGCGGGRGGGVYWLLHYQSYGKKINTSCQLSPTNTCAPCSCNGSGAMSGEIRYNAMKKRRKATAIISNITLYKKKLSTGNQVVLYFLLWEECIWV